MLHFKRFVVFVIILGIANVLLVVSDMMEEGFKESIKSGLDFKMGGRDYRCYRVKTTKRISRMNFGQAIEHLKGNDENATISRKSWLKDDVRPVIKLQRPDNNSKMSDKYLYIERDSEGMPAGRMPASFGSESILAEDWEIIE